MSNHRAIVELSDAELDLVAGGCGCECVLQTPAQCGKIVEQANVCNTPAANTGWIKVRAIMALGSFASTKQ